MPSQPYVPTQVTWRIHGVSRFLVILDCIDAVFLIPVGHNRLKGWVQSICKEEWALAYSMSLARSAISCAQPTTFLLCRSVKRPMQKLQAGEPKQANSKPATSSAAPQASTKGKTLYKHKTLHPRLVKSKTYSRWELTFVILVAILALAKLRIWLCICRLLDFAIASFSNVSPSGPKASLYLAGKAMLQRNLLWFIPLLKAVFAWDVVTCFQDLILKDIPKACSSWKAIKHTIMYARCHN